MNRDTFVQTTKDQLDLWNARLKEAESRLETVRADRKKEAHRKIAHVREMAGSLRTRLERAGNEAQDGWAGVRTELEQAMDEFRKAAVDVWDAARS